MQEATISTVPTIPTRFTKRYGIRHPFALASMAFAGWAPPLALAVCRAGGLGTIGAPLLPADAVRELVQSMKTASDGPFNMGFITHFDHDAQVRICAEEGVAAVTFHWGHPSPELVRHLKDAGCDVWEQVGSIEAARRAVGDGVDVIIAQGHEAGGHNYNGRANDGFGTFALVPTMRDALGDDVLLLASGGIADGRGVAAALHLGADAVWVGTRMVATAEATVHEEYKQKIVAATGSDTVHSWIFGNDDPAFNPMRVLRNRVVETWNHRVSQLPIQADNLDKIGTTVIGGQAVELSKFTRILPLPETVGDLEEMPLLAGQGVGLIHDIAPAEEVVERMMSEAAAQLARGLKVRFG